jgi:hypothetical protein
MSKMVAIQKELEKGGDHLDEQTTAKALNLGLSLVWKLGKMQV